MGRMLPVSLALMVGWILHTSAHAQPEVPTTTEIQGDERAVLERELMQREQVMDDMAHALQEMEARLNAGGGDMGEKLVGRLFPVTAQVQANPDQIRGLAALLESMVGQMGNTIVAVGPVWAVDLIGQALATIDPATRPPLINLEARFYLATQALPPEFSTPGDDPLLAQVKQVSGYPAVALVNASTLAGLEGDPMLVEGEAGVEGGGFEIRSRSFLKATARAMGEEIEMRVAGELEISMGPGFIGRRRFEQVLRTAPGQAAFITFADPVFKNTTVLALTPKVEK